MALVVPFRGHAMSLAMPKLFESVDLAILEPHAVRALFFSVHKLSIDGGSAIFVPLFMDAVYLAMDEGGFQFFIAVGPPLLLRTVRFPFVVKIGIADELILGL